MPFSPFTSYSRHLIRGVASRYEEALADLGTAASHAPEDKNVIKASARVKKLQKKQEDKEKKMCGCLPPSPVGGLRHMLCRCAG